MADYSQMTDKEFDDILQEIVVQEANTLLMIPEVNTVLREYFNDAVLEQWEKLNPEKAFPVDDSQLSDVMKEKVRLGMDDLKNGRVSEF